MNNRYASTPTLLFFGGALAVLFFFWTRIDFSNRIYYFGDGNVVVELIRLMLSSHDWDPNWWRLETMITPQPEALTPTPSHDSSSIFYNLAGYILTGAGITKILYGLGFGDWPIPAILRGFNILIQMATLWLLYLTGKKLFNTYAGLLAALLFVVFPLVVMEAHYERPETWLCFLLTAALCCCVYFYDAPLRYSALIGVLTALSMASKTNQILLLAMPGLLLLHSWLTTKTETAAVKTKKLFISGAAMLLCLLLTLFIHTPFLLTHLGDVIQGLKDQAVFYHSSAYPYSEEHYSFAGQLLVSLRYFHFTLGSLWCLFFVIGFVFLVNDYLQAPTSKKIVNITIVLPIVILFTFSASLTVFAERSLSSLEGSLCLVTAVGFVYALQQLQQLIKNRALSTALTSAFLLLMLLTPLHLSYVFVDSYIHHPKKPKRVLFQEELKKDFPKFWIKNVYFALKVRGELPDKPEKAPRLYQIDDLNEHWTPKYLALLEQNGFRKVATYCSEFSKQPPNTLTIYHAAAKNHYYVRSDEWPAEVATGYFKTNCL